MITAACSCCTNVVELRPCGLDTAVLLPSGWKFKRDLNGVTRLYCNECEVFCAPPTVEQ